jgi:N-acetylglucosamine kinase-like BadF-type ATPase
MPELMVCSAAFDLGRCAIRHATDDFDAGLEVEGGLAQTIREHFGVDQTGEVLAKVVRARGSCLDHRCDPSHPGHLDE